MMKTPLAASTTAVALGRGYRRRCFASSQSRCGVCSIGQSSYNGHQRQRQSVMSVKALHYENNHSNGCVMSVKALQYENNHSNGSTDTYSSKRYLSTASNNSNGSNVIRRNNHSILSKEAATAPIDYPTSKRFWALPPAIAIHLSIGSVYVYSMWTPGFSKAVGVIAAAPNDWTHSELLPVFSTAAVVLGVTTSALGEWVEKVGPRTSGMVGSMCWSSALLTTAGGVQMHNLPLVYLGYGVLGGVGWGLMYLTPVTSAMKWFPDRRGFATGIALSAFGAGAAIAPSIIHVLVDNFAVAPEYIGDCLLTCSDAVGEATAQLVDLDTLSDGSQVVSSTSPIGEAGTQVVVATEADVTKFSTDSMKSGVYAIGAGDTGVSKAMATLGVFYGGLGALGSRFMQIPHPDWKPENASVAQDGKENEAVESNNIGLPASYVTTNTRQFPLMWMSVFGNATGGLALLSSSKLMLTDVFAGVAPNVITPAFSTGYVSALGIGMALGRFGWSTISDVLGRQNTYALFGLGIPIVGMAPYLCHTVVRVGTEGGDIMPYLMTFYGGSVLAITFYGGIFSVLPAYIADTFGQKHAGAIHGKALTAWAAASVAGPMGLASLRAYSYENAMQDLLQTVEAHDGASSFESSFGVQLSDTEAIDKLINAKTLTIEKLMTIAPPGTIDPTPFLYDTTCYIAAGLMGVAAMSNLVIKPLDLSKELNNIGAAQQRR